MELVRNEKLNGIELTLTKAEKNNTDILKKIASLGWHYSSRKGHHYHIYDEALIASTMKVFPALDKKAKKSAAPAKPERPTATKAKTSKPTATKAQTSKAKTSKPTATKTTKPKASKTTVTASPDVTPFSIEKAGFKADPSIGVTDLKVWKAAVLHSVEEILDSAIAALAQ